MNTPLYEKQIRELLDRTGSVDPPESRWAGIRRRLWPFLNRVTLCSGRLRWLAPTQQVMVASYGLALVAFILGLIWRPLGAWIGASAATIFALSYLASLMNNRRQPRTPTWRGRPLN